MAYLLIVDNDERIVELTSWFLERAGHRVDTALTYLEARKLISREVPDLMLADLDLGKENGREELPKLAMEGCLPATLVISGFLDAELDRELRLIPGVRSTLTKPVDLKALEGVIQATLMAGGGAPSPDQGPVSRTCAGPQPEDDEDGWVEIVPFRPEVLPDGPVPESSPRIPAVGQKNPIESPEDA